MTTNPRAGVAMVLLAAALWGTTGTAQALAPGSLPSVWFGALRLLVAAAFFAVYARLTLPGRSSDGSSAGPRDGIAPALPRWPVLGAGACMAVYNLAFFAGIRDTGVAVGTAVALGSGPVWAGVLQSVLARQVPPAGWWAGTALAVTGGVLLTMSGTAVAASVGGIGVALCLLSGLSYAVYSIFNKRLVDAAPPAAVTVRVFGVAAALALPAAWLEAGVPRMGWADVGPVVYVGVVTAGFAYLLFSHALRHVSVATAVSLALCEPVVAFGLAVAVVGEPASAPAIAGLLLVCVGVLAVVRAELRGAAARRAPDPVEQMT